MPLVTVYEVIPFKGTFEKVQALPHGSKVSITASPAKGLDATLELAGALHDTGYAAIPHLSARMIENRAHLDRIIADLDAAGIDRIFVVGGDAEEPGEYFDAVTLLSAIRESGHPFSEVGITGYPEGHPFISDEKLWEALAAKREMGTYIATQMCFDVATIRRWIEEVRARGIDLPVMVGIPGVVDPVKLAGIAARIGVGSSIRYLSKNRRAVGRLLRPGSYKPDGLVTKLTALPAELGIGGLHVFTFNQIEATAAWAAHEAD